MLRRRVAWRIRGGGIAEIADFQCAHLVQQHAGRIEVGVKDALGVQRVQTVVKLVEDWRPRALVSD
jgi:hypothetical protein